MALLYKRVVEVTVGTLLIKGLRVNFNVMRNLRSQPNQATLKIWNLSKESRSLLEQDQVPVKIEAGYEDTIGLIFEGNMRKPLTVRDGPDIITQLQAGDGERAIRRSRSNFSFKPGTPFTNVLKKLVSALAGTGLGTKDAQRKLGGIKLRTALTQLVNGVVVSGNSYQQLQGFLKGSGFEASVQDGQLQIIEIGKPTNELAVKLTSETGLVGAPEIGEKGKVKCRSLLQPRIRPGRKAEIQSEFVSGFYRAQVVNHVGDTHATEWYTEIEANPL